MRDSLVRIGKEPLQQILHIPWENAKMYEIIFVDNIIMISLLYSIIANPWYVHGSCGKTDCITLLYV